MNRRARPIQIVVEGIGDVVGKPGFYGDALERVKRALGDSADIVFCDLRANWATDASLHAKREATVSKVEAYGARFIDKSDQSMHDAYAELNPDYLIVATTDCSHLEVASGWLSRGPGAFGQMFIEKPLTRTLCEGARLLREMSHFCRTEQDANRILAFDHYHARFKPTGAQMDEILGQLGSIRGFTFYFLEDGSGGEHNGPIENELRVDALMEGVILNMMPHVMAIAGCFGSLNTMWVRSVRAGQYTGVDFDRRMRTRIRKETFAELRFSFASPLITARNGARSQSGSQGCAEVSGVAYVGKGIRGVQELAVRSPVKLLELKGTTGEKLRVDFAKGQMLLIDSGVDLSDALRRRPYFDFVESMVPELRRHGTFSSYGQSLSHGLRILEGLSVMRCPINEIVARKSDGLPTYELGDRAGDAPYLEEVIEQVADGEVASPASI
jgi:predicted dehydrogenase